MAKLQVQSFKEKTTKNGKTFYMVSGLLDGSPEVVTMWDKPEEGKEYEGTTKENDYGITFSLPRQGGGGGGYGRNNPETAMQIIRQNALTNAVNRAVALSQLLPQEEAQEALKPSNIVMAAVWFAKYSAGEWTPTMPTAAKKAEPQPEDSGVQAVRETFPEAQEISEDANRQANHSQVNEDVNPSDIPF